MTFRATLNTRMKAGMFAMAVVLQTWSIPVGAQPRLEMFGSLTLPFGTHTGRFVTDYRPVQNGESTEGRAGQALSLDTSGLDFGGFEGGINVLFGPRAGIQVFVNRSSRTFDAPNTPFEEQFSYRSFGYWIGDLWNPEHVAFEERSEPWPDSQGTVRNWHVATNGLLRFDGHGADVTVTGGLLLSRASGRFAKVAFHEYEVLCTSRMYGLCHMQLNASMQFKGWSLGGNVGGEIAVPVGRHTAVTAGIRLLTSPRRPRAEVAEIVDYAWHFKHCNTEVCPPISLGELEAGQAADGTQSLTRTFSESTIRAALQKNPANFDDRFIPELRIGVRIF